MVILRFFDLGLGPDEIAQKIGCSKATVTKVISRERGPQAKS